MIKRTLKKLAQTDKIGRETVLHIKKDSARFCLAGNKNLLSFAVNLQTEALQFPDNHKVLSRFGFKTPGF